MLLHNWSKHVMIPLFRASIAKSLCQMESTRTAESHAITYCSHRQIIVVFFYAETQNH